MANNNHNLTVMKKKNIKTAAALNSLSGVMFFLGATLSASSNIPYISVVTKPLSMGISLLGYLTWRAAIHNDPKMMMSKKFIQRTAPKYLNKKNPGTKSYKISAYLGIAASGLLIASFMAPPLAPLFFAMSAAMLFSSNISWSIGAYKEYKQAKTAKKKGLKSNQKLYDASYAVTSTIASFCLGVSIIFPPVAAVFLAISAISAIAAIRSYIKSSQLKKEIKKSKIELTKDKATKKEIPKEKLKLDKNKINKLLKKSNSLNFSLRRREKFIVKKSPKSNNKPSPSAKPT